MAGMVLWHGDGTDVVVLGGGGRTSLGPAGVLEALRTSGVRTIDLLVIADASVPESVVSAVVDAHATGAVVAQSDVPLDDAGRTSIRVPSAGTRLDLGGLRVRIAVVPGRLVVDAVPRGP
jgi:hypothetical protein